VQQLLASGRHHQFAVSPSGQGRRKRVDAEAGRLYDLGATLLSDLSEEPGEGVDHYAVALTDPEGNEFDIN